MVASRTVDTQENLKKEYMWEDTRNFLCTENVKTYVVDLLRK